MIGKSLCFKGVVPSAFIASLRTDSLQEENKARRDDRPSSSHLSTLSGNIHMKKHPVMTVQFLRKCSITAVGKHGQGAVYWAKLSRAQDQVVHNLVPAYCIYRVISQNGDRTVFERLSTPRPAPKVTLWSNWQSQQQQPLSGSVSSSSRKLDAVETENEMSKAIRQRIQVFLASGNWSGVLCHLLTKSQKIEIDLREEGVPQDAI